MFIHANYVWMIMKNLRIEDFLPALPMWLAKLFATNSVVVTAVMMMYPPSERTKRRKRFPTRNGIKYEGKQATFDSD